MTAKQLAILDMAETERNMLPFEQLIIDSLEKEPDDEIEDLSDFVC